MQANILFLVSPHFYQAMVDALNRIRPNCETAVMVYENFRQIPGIFSETISGFDAVMIAGTSAKHIIDISFPNNQKPVIAFQPDSDALHRDILRFAMASQNLDFSRIAMDFMVPMHTGYSVADFLNHSDMDEIIQLNCELMESQYPDHSAKMEESILEGIVALWEQGSIDLVFCLYASIVPQLKRLGIPFRCPFISDGHLKRLIRDTLTRVELQKLHNNHPAILQVFPRNTAAITEDQLNQLQSALEAYLRTNMIECVIQRAGSSCVAATTLQVLRFLTSDFETCRISPWLKKALDFPTNIGYGIGTTIPHAMNNVQIASKEARMLNQPFVVDSNGNLIGPLGSEKQMVISAGSMTDVSEIAKRCSLSAMTIQRLMAITHSTGSDKLTTQELAQYLQTTVRNANRIMLNLCKGNVAKPVYTQTSHSRGRPVQVYALDFGIK